MYDAHNDMYIYTYTHIYACVCLCVCMCVYDVCIHIYIQCATMPSVHRRVYWLGLAPTYYDFSFLRWLFLRFVAGKGETPRPERREYLKKITDASVRIFDGKRKKWERSREWDSTFSFDFRASPIPSTRYDICCKMKYDRTIWNWREAKRKGIVFPTISGKILGTIRWT